MADWYAKLCKENPLITYLEDPFQEPQGYKTIQDKLKEAEVEQTVDIGVKTFINQSLAELREHTAFIEPEPEPEQEEEEEEAKEGEGEGEAEKAEEPPAEEPPKADKKGKKGKEEPPPEPAEGEEPEPEDPNKDKFAPTVVNFK